MSDDPELGGAERNDMNVARQPRPRAGRHRTDGPPAGLGLDDIAAERLLDGKCVSDPVAATVSRVLDAATAPAEPDELRHAEAVFAAYAARPRRVTTVLFGRRLARLLGLKLVAAVAVATAAGGIALAASTGVLPTPLHPRPAQPHASASPKPAASTKATPSPRPSPAPSASVAPSIATLCSAYLATEPSQREKALTTPGFAALINAAGGADKVARFCATAAERSAAPRATPSRHPTGKPSVQPSHPVTGGSAEKQG
jgi:hypothetical protein